MFSGNEDVRIGWPHPLDQLQHRSHLRRLGDERRWPVRAAVSRRCATVAPQKSILGIESPRAAQRPSELDEVAQRDEQTRVIPRLLYVVLRTAPHCLDSATNTSPRRHHRNRQVRFDLLQPLQQIEAFPTRCRVARVVHVHQQRVVVAPLERRQDTVG
jgi:hypothetical protein